MAPFVPFSPYWMVLELMHDSQEKLGTRFCRIGKETCLKEYNRYFAYVLEDFNFWKRRSVRLNWALPYGKYKSKITRMPNVPVRANKTLIGLHGILDRTCASITRNMHDACGSPKVKEFLHCTFLFLNWEVQFSSSCNVSYAKESSQYCWRTFRLLGFLRSGIACIVPFSSFPWLRSGEYMVYYLCTMYIPVYFIFLSSSVTWAYNRARH